MLGDHARRGKSLPYQTSAGVPSWQLAPAGRPDGRTLEDRNRFTLAFELALNVNQVAYTLAYADQRNP